MRQLPVGICLVVLTASVAAQAPQPVPESARPAFEVASIKRNVSGDQNSSITQQPGGRVVVTNNTLYNLIRNAYGIQRFELVPGKQVPSWIDSDRWDILAKEPEGAQQSVTQLRLRSLLEDRFKVVARREKREMPIYELVIVRNDGQLGPKMKPSGDECERAAKARAAGEPPAMPPGGFCGTRANNGVVSMRGVPLANFVRNMGGMTGRFVIDKTGLTGPYDLDLQWSPDPSFAGPAAPPGQGDGASLFAALQEQLGLRLVATKGPVEVLVLDSAERPTED